MGLGVWSLGLWSLGLWGLGLWGLGLWGLGLWDLRGLGHWGLRLWACEGFGPFGSGRLVSEPFTAGPSDVAAFGVCLRCPGLQRLGLCGLGLRGPLPQGAGASLPVSVGRLGLSLGL